MLAFIFGPNWQWIILLVIVLLIFGNRIPGIAKSLGSGITEFKKGLKEGNDEKNKQLPEGGPEQPKP